jgi:hypothetical protein
MCDLLGGCTSVFEKLMENPHDQVTYSKWVFLFALDYNTLRRAQSIKRA